MEEREKLALAKVGVVAHNFFRKQISDPLDTGGGLGRVGYAAAKPALSRSLAKMVSFHAAQDRVIMSDENIAGSILTAVGTAGLYPDIKRRLAVVLDSMPSGHETRVFFSVRGYAQHFSSIYAYRAGMGETDKMETFRGCALNLKRGWADVVADICAVAGAERTVVWPYEEFSKAPAKVNYAMLGAWKPRVFVKSDKASLPSLTRKGLAVLERVADMLTPREHEGLARVVARFDFDKPDEKFSLFNPEQTANLMERYERDLAAIEALGCRLNVPEPPKSVQSPVAADQGVDAGKPTPSAVS